ncbi:arylsulfatase [Lentisphaera marina]|uniref:sulfatase family protein n=1 Tax=Lentisphaera marina TaxID=1111041 RepID=UPI002365D130|nr:arylsulfatase [Lentisphaera marina]MDD7985228.1 arylsulfatase [Lentisphaera marina]
MNKFILLITLSLTTLLSAAKQPNIIYVLMDDMGQGDVSCFNPSSKIHTPHIDSLAANGMMFTDAHTNSSVCTPTRYGILTGRYAWRTHLKKSVVGGTSPSLIKPGRMTLASFLKEQGYHTGMIGKWHLGWDFSFHPDSVEIDPLYWGYTPGTKINYSKGVKNGPDVHGFDYYYSLPSSLDIPPYLYVENGEITNLDITERKGEEGKRLWRGGPMSADFDIEDCTPNFFRRANKFIAQNANADKPFFLYLPLPSPHTPILPIKEFQGKSGINEYADFVLQIDHHMGELIKTLKEQNIFDNTLLVFTADNGISPRADIAEINNAGHFPSNGFRGRKADIYEGGHRVPYIVTWPNGGVKAASITNQTICTTDMLATLADILGKKLPDNAGEDSYSTLPLLLSKPYNFARPATVHHSINGSFAIRQGDWKLIFCAGSGGWPKSDLTPDMAKAQGLPVIQLYNLKSDPAETVNLYKSYPHIVDRLTTQMQKLIDDGRSTPGKPQKNTGATPFLPEGFAELSAKLPRKIETNIKVDGIK